MLTKKDVIAKLKAGMPYLSQYGIHQIGVFGSYSRNAHDKNSDIDLLLDFDEKEENFDNYMAACELLEASFNGEKIDIVTKNGLSPHFRQQILDEVEYVLSFDQLLKTY